MLLLLLLSVWPAAASAAAACTFKKDVDFQPAGGAPSHDLGNAPAVTQQDCCDLCAAEPLCTVGVWNGNIDPKPNPPRCYYKGADSSVSRASGGSVACLSCAHKPAPGDQAALVNGCPAGGAAGGGGGYPGWMLCVDILALVACGSAASVCFARRTGRETASQFFTLRAVVMDGFSFFVSTIRRNRAGAWGGGGYDAVGGAKAATGEGERGRGDGGAAGGGGGGLGGERYRQGQTVEYQSSAGWVAATVQRDSGGPKLDLGELLLLALLEFLLVLVLLLLVLLLPLLLTLPPFFLSLR